MGSETYFRTEVEIQADVDRLNAVATYVVNSDYGDFLKAMADAWLQADYWNKRIIRPAWSAIVSKYDLDKEVK